MMNSSHQTTWFKVQPRRRGRASIKIGAGFIAMGLFFAVAQMSEPYVKVQSPGPEAVIAVHTLKRASGPNDLQAAIDKSPVVKDVSHAALITPDIAATAVPSKKPVFFVERKTPRHDARDVALKGDMLPGVLRFDHCKPACETQDPLIVGSRKRTNVAEARSMAYDEDETAFNRSPFQSTRDILARTVDAPRAVLRTGRNVFQRFID